MTEHKNIWHRKLQRLSPIIKNEQSGELDRRFSKKSLLLRFYLQFKYGKNKQSPLDHQ